MSEALPHIVLLFAEVCLLSGGILGLFWLRPYLGLAPLYVGIGALQYLSLILATSVYVEIGGALLSPGSVVIFPGTLATVLLVYHWGDAVEARKLIYSLVLANAFVSAFAFLAGRHTVLPGGVVVAPLPPELFSQDLVAMMLGTFVTLLDVVLVIIVYEWVARRWPNRLIVNLSLALSVTLAFDAIVFTTIVLSGSPDFLRILVSSIGARTAVALVYATIIGLYLRFGVSKDGAEEAVGRVRDLFHMLTYRQKYEMAQELAVRDSLTALYNRAYFDQALQREINRSTRYGKSFVLALIDADHFKTINDRFGHQEGDLALQCIAETLQSVLRDTDVACRYGGEEFAALLTESDMTSAAAVVERFRTALASACGADQGQAWDRVTITAGLAICPDDGTTPHALVRVADDRLYSGKKAGRDRVVVHDDVAGATLD